MQQTNEELNIPLSSRSQTGNQSNDQLFGTATCLQDTPSARQAQAKRLPPEGIFFKAAAYVKQNKHIWLLLYVPFYLSWFFLLEHFGKNTGYWVSYLPLDDHIPFLEGFVVPYSLWYLFLLLPGIYLLVNDVPAFRRYLYFIMIGFSVCLAFCMFFPNGQDLRPAVFPRDNFFTHWVGLIYAADTNTNVLPSMHVVGSIAVACAMCRSRKVSSRLVKWGFVLLAALISVSTVFVKQHSVLDIYASVAVCVPIFFVVYWPELKKRSDANANARAGAR